MIPFAATAAAALVSATWEGTILTVCVALALRLLPGLSAAVRSLLWTAVFLVTFALHFVPVHASAQNAAGLHAVTLHADPLWSLALAAVWLLLSLFRAAEFALSALRLRQIASRATPLAQQPIHSASSPATRSFILCTSRDVDRPSVLGFLHPRILLPAGLAETLSLAELHQILLHETEHLRRSDDWTNLLQKLALVLFPLNPVLLWIERRLCLERELACDDRVLRATGAPKAYATCLTRIAEHGMFSRGLSLALGAWRRQSELSARVHRILSRPGRTFTGTQTSFAAAVMLLGVVAASATLARAPRLITFSAAPAARPALVASAIASPGQAVTLGSYRAVPVKAVMPVSDRQPALARSVRRRVSGSRSAACNAQRLIKTTATISGAAGSAVQSRTIRTRVVLTRASGDVPQIQQFVIPTVAYVPAYAAVRTPDGWIIIQL